MTTLIYNALIVNEGITQHGALLIDGQQIAAIYTTEDALPHADHTVDAQGAYLLPGVIDSHVHFREPGLTQKGDIQSESQAALAGGVTSVMDMPNVVPQTTTNEHWAQRMQLGAKHSFVNYAYYLGATNDNLHEIETVDTKYVPAIKLFMGSSTGNMLVDNQDTLRQLFSRTPLPIMTHCEDTNIINLRMQEAQTQWGEDPTVEYHPWIRSREACLRSATLAAQLARETGAKLHIAHLSTKEELDLVSDNVTAEACVGHLIFCDQDYHTLGTRIKVNPSIKTNTDRQALRQALSDGRITTIATDHAPHQLSDKQGGAKGAASGMPMIQFSLPCMMDLVSQGVLSIERMVQLMCHAPATLFNIKKRGFLRPGYQADIVLVEPYKWTLTHTDILSKCQWSPLEGKTLYHHVIQTYINGHLCYDHGSILPTRYAQALEFEH